MKKQILAVSMVAGLMAGLVGVANAAATLTVNGQVLDTTCDVSISKTPTVNLTALATDWATAGLGHIATSGIGNTNNSSPSMLQVKDCTAAAGVTPKILLQGDVVSGQDKLFTNDPTANIAIVVSGSPITAADTTSTDILTNNAAFVTGTASEALAASGATNTYPIYVAMAQATATAPAAGDNVTASLNFVYDAQ